MSIPAYPWYAIVQGDEIEQGDIFEHCPVFLPPDDLADHDLNTAEFRWEERDLIVLSQTCDLVKGREKVIDVLLCAVWNRSEFTSGHLATARGMEDARRGSLPGFHIIAANEGPMSFEREVRVVDFRRVYSLPISFLRRFATDQEDHLRLLPPYREHLSQAFARFFMRVGLPVDIPPFR
jgi:hypothetical protein